MNRNEIKGIDRRNRKKASGAYRGPLGQIRKLCLDCSDGPKSVRYCCAIECPLWIYRFGKYPKRVVREEGQEARRFFDSAFVLESAKKEEAGS